MNRNPFSDEAVSLSLLKERAFNLRWATVGDGVIPLTAADPDFPVANEIREAIRRYAKDGYFCYGPPEGLPDLKAAAAGYFDETRNLPYSPEQVFPVNSAASGMFAIARLLLNPGDEAIIFDPVDFLFRASVEAAGAKAVLCRIDKDACTFDPLEIQKLITARTRMIGLCNPHNPLGRVFTEKELLSLAGIASDHDLWIMSDEIWSDIVYAPSKFISIASLGAEIAKRTFTVYGFSKAYGLAGLRIGLVIAPDAAWCEALIDSSLVRTTAQGTATISQIAAQAALEKCSYWKSDFLSHLTKMRNEAHSRLIDMGIECALPEGTYVLFPKVPSGSGTSAQWADYLLKEANVVVVPGDPRWFGPGAEGHFRICFSTSRNILSEALGRMESALHKVR